MSNSILTETTLRVQTPNTAARLRWRQLNSFISLLSHLCLSLALTYRALHGARQHPTFVLFLDVEFSPSNELEESSGRFYRTILCRTL